MKRSISFFFAVACAALFGCSSSSSSSPGGGGTTVQQACTDISAAFCAKFNSCAPLYISLSYPDIATCQTRVINGCTSFPTANGSKLTADQIEACAKAVQAASCSTIIDGGVGSLPECNVSGTLDNGKPCAGNYQCSSGFCPVDSKTQCGTCAAQTNVGDACVDTSCSAGQTCVTSSTDKVGKCQKPAAAGADCTGSCVYGTSCVSGKCTAYLKDGDACDATNGPTCDLANGYVCKVVSGTTAGKCGKITLPKTGEACDVSTYWICGGSARCSVTGSGSGTCQAPAADGASCDATKGPDCMAPASCVSGVCKLTDVNSCK